MALDGIVLSNVVFELRQLLIGGRIDKIAQPEKDELLITIRNNKNSYKLLLSVDASLPRIHITDQPKKSPLTPPTFCMLLRKHLKNGKITQIKQPNFERIIEIYFNHLNELGDLCEKVLIIEIMGRHSNIILCDDTSKIIDSIKRVNSFMSSVREVIPGREYSYPPAKNKINPLTISNFLEFKSCINKPIIIHKALYQTFIGFSPLIAEEICYRANINSSLNYEALNEEQLLAIYNAFQDIITIVNNDNYSPNIIRDDDESYIDFSVLKLSCYKNKTSINYESISSLLDCYYKNRSIQTRMKQKSVDIRKLVQTNIDRCRKKLELQNKQIEDTQDKDIFKIKGELINANIYTIKEGDTKIEVYNYYDNKNIVITLNPNLTPSENSQKYFSKYNKKKRTLIALTEQIKLTKQELNHLESIKYALDFAPTEEDIIDIRKELMEAGYIKFRKIKGKKALGKSEPLHYISSDGFDIYIGKNNYQNDELSLHFASSKDWWFHTKEVPGSHVIVKTKGKELPDRTFEEAAALAAFYSKAKNNTKVAVDYTLKKNLKKPNGSVPGYLIYHTNYSMYVKPSECNLEKFNN